MEDKRIVAADGSGDYRTVQEAVDAVPAGRENRTIIYIKNGIYREKLRIGKRGLRLVGESANGTVIVYGDYARKTFPDGEPYHTFHTYTALIAADEVSVERISFVNDAGPGDKVGQALAAYVDGDRVSFRDCRFIGHQDTLFTGPLPPQAAERGSFGGPRDLLPRRHVRQFYSRCYIEGDVDFIFGSATAVFYRCEIFSKRRESGDPAVHGWIAAPSTTEGAALGYVFLECRLTGDAPQGSVYLGRPWREHAKAAFLHCSMDGHIHPEGWADWNGRAASGSTSFVEYGNEGPGADGARRADWSRRLSDRDAGQLERGWPFADGNGCGSRSTETEHADKKTGSR